MNSHNRESRGLESKGLESGDLKSGGQNLDLRFSNLESYSLEFGGSRV